MIVYHFDFIQGAWKFVLKLAMGGVNIKECGVCTNNPCIKASPCILFFEAFLGIGAYFGCPRKSQESHKAMGDVLDKSNISKEDAEYWNLRLG